MGKYIKKGDKLTDWSHKNWNYDRDSAPTSAQNKAVDKILSDKKDLFAPQSVRENKEKADGFIAGFGDKGKGNN